MILLQCWDDGVTADASLLDILRKHRAKATFNLCAGTHDKTRRHSWDYRGTEVWKLGLDEMPDLYAGFTIANHSLTHPHLDRLPIAQARREIAHGRERLQKIFKNQEVLGFAYPFGTYTEAVKEAVREAGHVYARTCVNVDFPVPPADPMEFHPNCHFLAPDFWERYERAKAGGVFYFWGHSYELLTPEMWAAFDAQIARLSSEKDATWGELYDVFYL